VVRTRGSSSSAESSSEDGVAGRRTGGSLSPSPIWRVGGGGSLLLPSGLRSVTGEVESIAAVLPPFRAGSGGANEWTSGVPSSGDTRRDGSGGGTDGGGGMTAEMSRSIALGERSGGRGGNCTAGRGGGFGFEEGITLSLELLPFDSVRLWSPWFVGVGELLTFRGGTAGGAVIVCAMSDRSDSSSENGLCDGELELEGRSTFSSVWKSASTGTDVGWGGGGGGGGRRTGSIGG